MCDPFLVLIDTSRTYYYLVIEYRYVDFRVMTAAFTLGLLRVFPRIVQWLGCAGWCFYILMRDTWLRSDASGLPPRALLNHDLWHYYWRVSNWNLCRLFPCSSAVLGLPLQRPPADLLTPSHLEMADRPAKHGALQVARGKSTFLRGGITSKQEFIFIQPTLR